MKDKFIYSLVERELLEKFIKNTGMNNKAFDKYLKATSISAYVISAFTWKYSPEGTLFWNEIDLDWQQEIKDEDKTIEELLK